MKAVGTKTGDKVTYSVETRSNPGILGGKIDGPLQEMTFEWEGAEITMEHLLSSSDTSGQVETARYAIEAASEVLPLIAESIVKAVTYQPSPLLRGTNDDLKSKIMEAFLPYDEKFKELAESLVEKK